MAEDAGVNALLFEALDLEEQAVALPIQIFSLARRFADLANREEAQDMLVGVLAESPSAFVRRVPFIAIRFAGAYESQATDLETLLLKGLADEAGWVVYDAVWLAETMGGGISTVRAAVEKIADGSQPHFKDGNKSWAAARERATAVRFRLHGWRGGYFSASGWGALAA